MEDFKTIILGFFFKLTIFASVASSTLATEQALVHHDGNVAAISPLKLAGGELYDKNEGQMTSLSMADDTIKKSDINMFHEDNDADDYDNYEERETEEKWEHVKEVETNSNAIIDNAEDSYSDESCQDDDSDCPEYDLKGGECERNPDYMLVFCRKSCGLCDSNHNIRSQNDDVLFSDGNYEESEKKEEWEYDEEVEQNLNIINDNVQDEYIDSSCQDIDSDCQKYVLEEGECERNPDYMRISCRKTCEFCKSTNFYGNICLDVDKDCSVFNLAEECVDNLEYTELYCRKSCGFCVIHNDDDEVCVDGHDCKKGMYMDIDNDNDNAASVVDGNICQDVDENCFLYNPAMICEDAVYLEYSSLYCKETCRFCDQINEYYTGGERYNLDVSFGLKQIIRGIENDDLLKEYIDSMQIYMREVVSKDPYDVMPYVCSNERTQCAEWAVQGACVSDLEYMLNHCAPMCQFCERS